MKKILKRNLSVLLAVMLLLSCWVFVAPEKASAAVDQELYEISVMVNVKNENDRDDNYYTITYIRPNGTTGSVKKVRAAQLTGGVNGNAEYREDRYSLEGIPIKLDYCCNGYEESTWYIEEVNLTSGNNARLFKGQLGARTVIYSRKTQGWIKFDTQEIYLEDHGYDREYNWGENDQYKAQCIKTGRPYVNEISMEQTPEDVQIPNEAGFTGDTPMTFFVKDQFGVRLASKYYGVSIEANDSNQHTSIRAVSDDSVASSTMEGYMIHVSEGAHRLQTVYNTNTHTWGGGGNDRFVEPMTLTVTDKKDDSKSKSYAFSLSLLQPTYTVYFAECQGGDGIIGPPNTVPNRTYSMAIAELPSADRVGHTFLGYYEGNGGVTQNANSIPSSFGTRISENTIVIGKERLDSNNRYYRPGDENHPYHAGWAAAPCTVTVLNNKRETVKTYVGQYGYTLQQSINTGYNATQLRQAAAYVKTPGESGEYNNLQPSSYIIESGKKYINSSEQVASEAQIGESFLDVVLVGDIVVRTDYTQAGTSKYTVNFYDNSTSALNPGTSSRSNYVYNENIVPPLSEERHSIVEDNTYTYEFVGWAKQRHEGETRYFVDVNENGTVSNAIPRVDVVNTPVTASVNYVAVYSRTFKNYSATFHYTKDGDEQVFYTQENAYHYGGHITPPETVIRTTENGEVRETPSANFIARGYTWVFDGWYTAETGGTRVTFNNMTDQNAMLNNVNGNEYWAHYTRGAVTKNLIRFFTKDGTQLAEREVNYSTSDTTSVPALEEIAYSKLEAKNLVEYDKGGTRYTFNHWVNIQNGVEYPYSELPLMPADYYPVYDEAPLHTLVLYNGETQLYSYTDVTGAELDISQLSDRILHPTRGADGYSNTYVFKGWSTVNDVVWTEGEELVDLEHFVYPDEDVYLYAHFETDPIEYHVRFFEDEEKTVLIADYTLHYGDPIIEPELTEEQTSKQADYYYNYTYMGWNLKPSETCIDDMDYYMTFRSNYQYYTVTWLDYDGNFYASDRYVYDGHMHKPYKDPVPPEYTGGESGMENVFDHWEYVNADGSSGYVDGEDVIESWGDFAVGHRIGGAIQDEIDSGKYTGPLTPAYWQANGEQIYLRAHYILTDKYVTISKYDGIEGDGAPFGHMFEEIVVKAGTTYAELDIQPYHYTKPNTDEYHYKFSRWQRISGNQAYGIADSYPFNDNVSIVEAYTTEQHGGADGSLWDTTVSKEPTFTEEGAYSRSCTATGCGYKETSGVIPVLQDTTPPTGTLYVKDYKWTSYPVVIDPNNPQEISLNSIIILNSDDMADNASDVAANGDFNRRGEGAGVASIAFSLADAASAPDDPTQITTWYTVYTDDEEGAPNASLMVRNLIGVTDEEDNLLFPQFENSDKLVIYAKITDKAAQANTAGGTAPNVTYLRSDALLVDNVKPTIVITSTDDPEEGSESAGITRIRHCQDATITIEDTDLATVTLNGETTYRMNDETLTTLDVGGLTEITVGDHVYEATDLGLQRAKEDDKYLYRYNTNLSGEGDPVYEIYAGDSADETTYTVTPEPAPGEETAEPIVYDLIPLYVYRYNTAGEGEDPVYELVNLPNLQETCTVGDQTYAVEGLHTYQYTVPGATEDLVNLVGRGLTITRRGQYQVVATDKAGNSSKTNFEIIGGHKLVTYVVDPTCTTDGLRAKRCTVCGTLPPEEQEVVPALGHRYAHKVIDPTCTANGREYDYCERCGIVKDGTEVILEATGHEWQSRQDAYVLRSATCIAAGMLRIKCTKCGVTKNEAYAALDPLGDNYRAALEAGTGESASSFGHSLYASETLPATCTEDGDVSRQCKYCDNYFVMQVMPALGHTPSTEQFMILEPATCTESGLRVPYCANGCGTVMYEEEFGDDYVEVVPPLGHNFEFKETVEPTEETEGYDLYECSRCDETDIRNVVPKTKYCDIKAYNLALNEDGTIELVELYSDHVKAGTQIYSAALNGEAGTNPTLESNDTFRYLFKGWGTELEDLTAIQNAAVAADANMPKDTESEETPPTDEPAESAVTLPETKQFPLTVEEDTTFYAVYMPKFVNYTIRLYKEDGVSHIRNVGYLHYGNLVAPRAPVKPDDAYGTWDFIGWQKLDPAPGEDATPTVNIPITGDANYKAVYQLNGEVRKYKVFWIYGEKVLGEATVEAGQAAVYTGAQPDPIALGLRPTADEHFYFSGWSGDTSCVTENMYVNAQFAKTLHTVSTEVSHLSCTTGEGTHRVCTVCGYVVEENYTRAPLGHDWQPTGATVNPVVHQDGTFVKGSRPEKCSRCDETRVLELDPVNLDVTVKDTAGTPLQGAKVTVYGDETSASKIMSALSGSDGVAHLLVPVAGRYRIVVDYEGKQSSSTVDVNSEGKITGGSVPVITATSSGSAQAAGCPKNCTCHKSGLWPTIYRFIHKFIYTLTRTRCCPDASYI